MVVLVTARTAPFCFCRAASYPATRSLRGESGTNPRVLAPNWRAWWLQEDGAGTRSAGAGSRLPYSKFLQLVARLEARAKGGKGVRASTGTWSGMFGSTL